MKTSTRTLLYSIVIDSIGAFTYFFPFFGEAGDFIWAPISAGLVYLLYRDAGVSAVNFTEELLPGLDVIPTATIAWLVNNYRQKPG